MRAITMYIFIPTNYFYPGGPQLSHLITLTCVLKLSSSVIKLNYSVINQAWYYHFIFNIKPINKQ